MYSKKQSRIRRGARTRAKIKHADIHRLCVNRTAKHMYATIISINGCEVLASASTLDKSIREEIQYSGNIKAAAIVGKYLGERAKNAGITRVGFDRSGFKYHGRVKALADAARAQGLQF